MLDVIETCAERSATMAIEAERDPRMYAVEDDPMRVAVVNSNGRPRPVIADPAPLGLTAYAVTLFVFSMFSTGLLNGSGAPIIQPVALAFGFLLQVLAAMWEFRRGNTFGAVVFGTVGALWGSYWLLQHFNIGQIPGGEVGAALGLFYIAWAIATAMLWVASTQTTAVVSLTLFLLTISLVLVGIGDAGAHTELVKVGGWFGLASAAVAIYGALASVVNSAVERTLLPLIPLRRAHA
jgi:succinate-acetate transporter protein